MKTIRGGAGLGDGLYVGAIARHMLLKGQGPLTVCSNYPELYGQMDVRVEPHRRTGITHLAHYSARKGSPATQFRDCCDAAGITCPVDLALDWNVTDPALVASLRAEAAGRPIVLVQLPRAPMARTDGFGAELLPDCRVIQRAIDLLADRALLVQVGAGRPLFEFKGLHVDLAGQTTVSQLLDVAKTCDAMLGYVSFFVPLAEVFDRRALLVWSRRGLKSRTAYVAQITPQKVLQKPSSRWVVDDCSGDELRTAVDALL